MEAETWRGGRGDRGGKVSQDGQGRRGKRQERVRFAQQELLTVEASGREEVVNEVQTVAVGGKN